MRDLEEIGLNEGGKPVSRPTPTAQEIAFLEREVGAKLPPEYIDFLQFSNGGHPVVDTFYVTLENVIQDWSISRFFYLEPTQGSTEELIQNYAWFRAEVEESVLPIANDGGGNLVCIDMRESRYGRILLWIHDSAIQNFVVIADSFSALIDSLTTNPDHV